MMGKTILLATTALVAFSLLAGPAMAQVSQSEYDALKERVERLESEAAQSNATLGTTTGSVNSRLSAIENGWWKDTKISGRMYWNITNVTEKSFGTKTSNSGTAFEIKRFYVGIDHKFDDIFSANITTDFQYSSGISSTEVYLKKAYLDAKLSDAFDVKVGSTDLPWVPFAEGVYGYRHVENTLIDRTKFGTSADWGVHVSGKLAAGVIQYAVAAVNGNGYKNPSRAKGVDLEGRVSLHYMGFIAGVGGYTGDKGAKEGTTTYHTASRFDGLVAYTDDKVRVGVEYFSADNYNNVTTVASDKADGWSAFASYQFDPQWSAFGKYEDVNPNKTTKPALENKYYNIGIQYSPAKIVDLALVYKHTDNSDGGITADTTTDEIGIWSQLRW